MDEESKRNSLRGATGTNSDNISRADESSEYVAKSPEEVEDHIDDVIGSMLIQVQEL